MGAAEQEQFTAWIGPHLPMLHRLARAFAQGADQHDLLQELMIAVWRAAPSFRGDAQISTFMYRVAHNTALTWRRRESTRRRRQHALAAIEPDEAGTGGDERLLARLYAAVRELGALDRSLIVLSLEGLSYAEIGAIHGFSETNVGARLTRARRKLADMMEKDDD